MIRRVSLQKDSARRKTHQGRPEKSFGGKKKSRQKKAKNEKARAGQEKQEPEGKTRGKAEPKKPQLSKGKH